MLIGGRGSCRKWKKEIFVNVDAKIEKLTKGIKVLELKSENVALSQAELFER
jgi:hypothetical protein